MVGYEVIEKAVQSRAMTVFQLDESLVQIGNIDSLFDTLQTSGAPLGILLEYAGGDRLKAAPFNGKTWAWHMNVYVLVRYQGDNDQIEIDARKNIDKIVTLVDGSHTLCGTAAVAWVEEIDQPIASTINDIPFYWIPFSLLILEKI
jgi:hypothetical protein